MKANIHPQYFTDAVVTCVCGNTFKTGSTQQVIHVELCSKCHPFYTGEQRFLDTRSVIKKFQDKQEKAKSYQVVISKKKEEKKKQSEGPKSLREMLMGLK